MLMTLWTVLSRVVALWCWKLDRSVARWEAEFAARAQAVMEANGARPPSDSMAQAERVRALGRLMDRRDAAEAAWESRRARAERLGTLHSWLTKPRTVAGGVAGAAGAGTVLVAAQVGGLDPAGWLVWLAQHVAAFL